MRYPPKMVSGREEEILVGGQISADYCLENWTPTLPQSDMRTLGVVNRRTSPRK